MHRTEFDVLAVVAACNCFMNEMVRFDLIKSTSSTLRRKEKVAMCIFNFQMAASLYNTFALMKAPRTFVQSPPVLLEVLASFFKLIDF